MHSVNTICLVLGLGDLRPHAPIMLAWMLGQFMAKGAPGLQATQRYGEVAMGANVLQVLHEMLQSDFNAHPLVSDILHSLAYGVMSALVQVIFNTVGSIKIATI